MQARKQLAASFRSFARATLTIGNGRGLVYAVRSIAGGVLSQPVYRVTANFASRTSPLIQTVLDRGFAAKAAKGGKKGKGGKKDGDDEEEDAEPQPSAGAKGKGKAASAAPPAAPPFNAAAAKGKFEGVLDAFRRDMAKLRTSRASPGMLAHIDVPAYEGSTVQLQTLGTIAARDAQTLVIMLYDPSTADAVQKAIMQAEVRKDIMDAAKKGAAAISEDDARRREKEARSLYSVDAALRGSREIQTMTDTAIKDIDTFVVDKEKDLKSNS